MRRPELYGISQSDIDADPNLKRHRTELIMAAAVLLDKHHLIKFDRKGGVFTSTDLGGLHLITILVIIVSQYLMNI